MEHNHLQYGHDDTDLLDQFMISCYDDDDDNDDQTTMDQAINDHHDHEFLAADHLHHHHQVGFSVPNHDHNHTPYPSGSDQHASIATRSTTEDCATKFVAFRTKTQLETLDDGFKWRKYGKKKVKNNLNPRHYYKCSSEGCSVKKRVERDGDDATVLITTYQGRHNHK